MTLDGILQLFDYNEIYKKFMSKTFGLPIVPTGINHKTGDIKLVITDKKLNIIGHVYVSLDYLLENSKNISMSYNENTKQAVLYQLHDTTPDELDHAINEDIKSLIDLIYGNSKYSE